MTAEQECSQPSGGGGGFFLSKRKILMDEVNRHASRWREAPVGGALGLPQNVFLKKCPDAKFAEDLA